MHILWIGHNLAYPPVRGVLQRNYNLLRQAAKQCEVHVLAFDQPATRPAGVSAEDCVRALRDFCAEVEYVSLPKGAWHRYRSAGKGLLAHEAYDLPWLRSKAMSERLREKVRRVPFDTLHFDTIGLAPYRAVVQGTGTVLNHHNVESSMMERRAVNETRRAWQWYWRWEARKLSLAEQRYCPQFAVNLVVSPEDGAALSACAAGIVTRVVPNGVDTEFFVPRPDPGGKTLLFCGGLDWYPNSDAMVYFFDAIWPRLTSVLPDVRVLVVGRRPPDWLRRLGDQDPRVQVTGFVDDVRPYFRAATAYICPIRVGGGTRLKILDALASGIPLIGTSFACSGIPIRHETHALLADSPEEFVAQTVRAVANPHLRTRLANQGRDLVCREYAWNVVGKSLLLAYQEASARTARPSPLSSVTVG